MVAATLPDRMWRPAGLDHVLITEGTTHAYENFSTSELSICLIGRSGLRVFRGRERHVARGGDIGVMHPGQPHAGLALDGQPWTFRGMCIELPQVYEAVAEPELVTRTLEYPDPVLHEPRLTRHFSRLHRALAEAAPPLEREGLLVAFLGEIAERSASSARRPSGPPDLAALRRACDYLNDHLADPVSLDTLATVAGTTKHALIRLFQRTLGAPPHAYHLGLRIRKARRLLENGMSPSQVGPAVGFYDQSHFHRHFRRTWGWTPGRYATAWRRSAARSDDLGAPVEPAGVLGDL